MNNSKHNKHNKHNKSNKSRASYSYQDVLMYCLPMYAKKNCHHAQEFISESKINIIGVTYYKAHNVPEVLKFKRFIET